jgi:hypothetical protein
MTGLQVVGPQQIGAVVLFDELAAGDAHHLGQDQGLQRPLRHDFVKQLGGLLVRDRKSQRLTAVAVEALDQPVGEQRVVLGLLLGCHRFHEARESAPVTPGAGLDQIDKQVGAWH